MIVRAVGGTGVDQNTCNLNVFAEISNVILVIQILYEFDDKFQTNNV